jgi:hypothetical protein
MAHLDLVSRWPVLAAELESALRAAAEPGLADQVATLQEVATCDCGDDFCQSFYTQPEPDGAYGPGHRNIVLSPDGPGMLVLDVVKDQIMYVEIVSRPPLS